MKHKPTKKKALNNENNECWLFLQGSVSSAAKGVTNDYRTEFEVLQIYNIFIFHLLEKLKRYVLKSTESAVIKKKRTPDYKA
jgi:hypothetical protein